MSEPEETAWWQDIGDFAYWLDAQAEKDWRAGCHDFLNRTPAPDPSDSLENFKRHAVVRLIEVFAAGPDPHAETEAEEYARFAAWRRSRIHLVPK